MLLAYHDSHRGSNSWGGCWTRRFEARISSHCCWFTFHFISLIIYLFIYLLETFPLTDIIFYLAILFFGIKSWDTESISGAFLLLAGTMIYRRLQLGSHDRLALTGSRSDGRERWIVFNFLEHLRRIQLQRVLFALEVSSLAFALTQNKRLFSYCHSGSEKNAWERRCIPLTLFHVSSNHIFNDYFRIFLIDCIIKMAHIGASYFW